MVKQRPDSSSLVQGTAQMTNTIERELEKPYKTNIEALKSELSKEGKAFTLENLLTKVTQKEQVVGDEKLVGLDKLGLQTLKNEIERIVKDLVSVHREAGFETWDIVHYKFAQWINDARRKNCIEIFTTNYDYLFEVAFEKFDITYFDGFVGSYKPFFHALSVEDDKLLNHWPKLWKIHGSLGWEYDKTSEKIIRIDNTVGSIVVYPSILKYDKSKKQPFVTYLDRLSNFIRTEDSVLFITGYSFGDDHINDTILSALKRSSNSSIIVFLFEDILDTDPLATLAKNQTKLSVYASKHGIIGGKYGEWKLKAEPSEDEAELMQSYFKRDLKEIIDKGKVVGHGELLTGSVGLGDFVKLTNFLSELNYLNYVSTHAK